MSHQFLTISTLLAVLGVGCGGTNVISFNGIQGSADGGGGAGGAASGGAAGRAMGGTGGNGGGSAQTKDSGSPSSCDRTCENGPCPRLAMTSRVVATSPRDQIYAFTVGPDRIYFGTLCNRSGCDFGEVRSVPLEGGESSVIVPSAQVTQVVLDGDRLYYIDSDLNIGNRQGIYDLRRVPTSGGPSEVLASGKALANVRVGANHVYYTDQGPSGGWRVLRFPRLSNDGWRLEVVVESEGPLPGWPDVIAIDDANIYWSPYQVGTSLFRRPLAGGATTTLGAFSEPIGGHVLHGGHLYFTTAEPPGACLGVVKRVPTTGGPAERLSPGTTGASSVGQVAVDDTYVYWWSLFWDRGADGDWLFRAPLAGGSPEVMLTERSDGKITVTATNLYWVSNMSGPWEVRTLSK